MSHFRGDIEGHDLSQITGASKNENSPQMAPAKGMSRSLSCSRILVKSLPHTALALGSCLLHTAVRRTGCRGEHRNHCDCPPVAYSLEAEIGNDLVVSGL